MEIQICSPLEKLFRGNARVSKVRNDGDVVPWPCLGGNHPPVLALQHFRTAVAGVPRRRTGLREGDKQNGKAGGGVEQNKGLESVAGMSIVICCPAVTDDSEGTRWTTAWDNVDIGDDTQP